MEQSRLYMGKGVAVRYLRCGRYPFLCGRLLYGGLRVLQYVFRYSESVYLFFKRNDSLFRYSEPFSLHDCSGIRERQQKERILDAYIDGDWIYSGSLAVWHGGWDK